MCVCVYAHTLTYICTYACSHDDRVVGVPLVLSCYGGTCESFLAQTWFRLFGVRIESFGFRAKGSAFPFWFQRLGFSFWV